MSKVLDAGSAPGDALAVPRFGGPVRSVRRRLPVFGTLGWALILVVCAAVTYPVYKIVQKADRGAQ